MTPLLLLLFVMIATVQQAVAASPATGEGKEMQQLPPELAECLATTYYQVVSAEASLPVDHIYGVYGDGEQFGKVEENDGNEMENDKDTDICDDEDSCESSGGSCPSQSIFYWIVINL